MSQLGVFLYTAWDLAMLFEVEQRQDDRGRNMLVVVSGCDLEIKQDVCTGSDDFLAISEEIFFASSPTFFGLQGVRCNCHPDNLLKHVVFE